MQVPDNPHFVSSIPDPNETDWNGNFWLVLKPDHIRRLMNGEVLVMGINGDEYGVILSFENHDSPAYREAIEKYRKWAWNSEPGILADHYPK